MNLHAHWLGKPCIARRVRVVVGPPTMEARWCAHLEGQERDAVEVIVEGKVFCLADERLLGLAHCERWFWK